MPHELHALGKPSPREGSISSRALQNKEDEDIWFKRTVCMAQFIASDPARVPCFPFCWIEGTKEVILTYRELVAAKM